MKHSKKILGGLAAIATTATVLAAGTVPAHADPVRPYAATGSDTIQDVWNGLTNDSTAVAPTIASYDAFDPDGKAYPIKTKTAGEWFVRPSGSGEGLRSLSAVWDTSDHTWSKAPSVPAGVSGTATPISKELTHEEIDFGRSSSRPSTSGTDLDYVPFARDALSVAYKPTGSLTALDLTTDQIKEIYSGVDAPVGGRVTFTGSGATAHVFVDGTEVHPKIPQTGSGTRGFFLGAIGLSALAAYISDPGGTGAGGLPENNGTVLTADGDMIPFSAAQWIAQNNAAPGTTDTTAGLELADVNGQAPFGTSGGTLTPGPLFGASSLGVYGTVPGTGAGVFNRDTYVIVPASFFGGGATSKQSNLTNILTGTLASGGARTIIRQYGFGALGYIANSSNYLGAPFTH